MNKIRKLEFQLEAFVTTLLIALLIILVMPMTKAGTVGSRQGDAYHQRTSVSITE